MARSSDISVVIPAFQAEGFIARTLDTVARQYKLPGEVIVVDDGSTDATCDVVESFATVHPEMSVRLLREPHRGPGATRNSGVRVASSDWIAFLDSDDLWYPEKIATMTDAIQACPEANFAYHNMLARALDDTERIANRGEGLSSDKSIPRQLFKRNYFSTSSVLCKRDLVIRWGGFDESLPSAQDYELWLKVSPDMIPVFVPDVLGIYVDRKGNISTSRYWKRLLNLLTVKYRHRAKAERGEFAYAVFYNVAVHVGLPIRDGLKQLLKPRTRK